MDGLSLGSGSDISQLCTSLITKRSLESGELEEGDKESTWQGFPRHEPQRRWPYAHKTDTLTFSLKSALHKALWEDKAHNEWFPHGHITRTDGRWFTLYLCSSSGEETFTTPNYITVLLTEVIISGWDPLAASWATDRYEITDYRRRERRLRSRC